VTDIVGQDDEIAADIERLARAIKLVGELRLEELLTGPITALSIVPAALRCGFPSVM